MNVTDMLASDWTSAGRTPQAAVALDALAERGVPVPAQCDNLFDLVAAMSSSGRTMTSVDAAAMVSAMLRHLDAHPLVTRALTQALVPGLVAVGHKLQWGSGGEWQNPTDFSVDLLATTWEVLTDWSGQDRPWAVRDILGAVRCRLRRRMLKERDLRRTHLEINELDTRGAITFDSDLEHLTRHLTILGPTQDAQVVYAASVMGYSVDEIADMTEVSHTAARRRLGRARERLAS